MSGDMLHVGAPVHRGPIPSWRVGTRRCKTRSSQTRP